MLLDNTVLNVAIPSPTDELHASTTDVQWMINAYSLVQSGLPLSAGSASDRYGRKKTLVAGLALFGVGSLAAGFAQSSGQLVAVRAGMGVGGALLIITTLAVVVQIFGDTERVKAIGIWSTVNSAGLAAGPLIGGAMLNHFWWGAIFLVSIPVAVVGLIAVVRPVPESKNPSGDGTLAEFGNGLGVAVLGAVLNSRFAALVPGAVGAASLPAALAAAEGPGERAGITDAFASGLETGQLVGAAAVLAGGLLAAALLRRAERTRTD